MQHELQKMHKHFLKSCFSLSLSLITSRTILYGIEDPSFLSLRWMSKNIWENYTVIVIICCLLVRAFKIFQECLQLYVWITVLQQMQRLAIKTFHTSCLIQDWFVCWPVVCHTGKRVLREVIRNVQVMERKRFLPHPTHSVNVF